MIARVFYSIYRRHNHLLHLLSPDHWATLAPPALSQEQRAKYSARKDALSRRIDRAPERPPFTAFPVYDDGNKDKDNGHTGLEMSISVGETNTMTYPT